MKRRKRRLAVIAAALLLAAVLCDWLSLRYHAKARYQEMKRAAKYICDAADHWISEGHSPAELTGEHHVSEQDGFGAYLNGLDSPYLLENDHYAVICNAEGEVQCVLYSHSRIADRYLESLPATDMFTSVQTLQIPVVWRFTVVCYP